MDMVMVLVVLFCRKSSSWQAGEAAEGYLGGKRDLVVAVSNCT